MKTAACLVSREIEEVSLLPRLVIRSDLIQDYEKTAEKISSALNIPLIVGKILSSRGFSTPEEASDFLYPSLKEHLDDPLKIKNILKASRQIIEAIEKNYSITVYCDFDVDGLTAGAQMLLLLKSMGADISAYVPSRFREGYGLAFSVVDKLKRNGTELLITVDCGISNHDEIAYAKKLGIKTLIIDHHQVGDILPCADVIVNPKQEGCEFKEYNLCAAGLVWMLSIVLIREAKQTWGEEKIQNIISSKELIDLAALGTICDMVPLIGMNRLIAYRGIEALRQTKRKGLIALKKSAGLSEYGTINSYQVSYVLGPRINAAGRLGDPTNVMQMLTTEHEAKARAVSESLEKLNTQRRAIEEYVLTCCISQIEQDEQLQKHKAIALYAKDYHIGVIGIAAQRLVQEYYKPSAVMAPGELLIGGELRQVVKGSIRGIEGFDVSAALSALSDLCISCGGHTQAGGFSLEFANLETFKSAFFELTNQMITREILQRKVKTDIRARLSDIDIYVAEAIRQLAPFGMGNPSPVLVFEDLEIVQVFPVGENHLKLRVRQGESIRDAIAWKMRGHPSLRKGQRITIASSIEISTYKGISSVQLNIREVW